MTFPGGKKCAPHFSAFSRIFCAFFRFLQNPAFSRIFPHFFRIFSGNWENVRKENVRKKFLVVEKCCVVEDCMHVRTWCLPCQGSLILSRLSREGILATGE